MACRARLRCTPRTGRLPGRPDAGARQLRSGIAGRAPSRTTRTPQPASARRDAGGGAAQGATDGDSNRSGHRRNRGSARPNARRNTSPDTSAFLIAAVAVPPSDRDALTGRAQWRNFSRPPAACASASQRIAAALLAILWTIRTAKVAQQRVRSVASRQGMPRRSTGSSRSARTSTYSRPPSAATCCAIIDLALPGGPPDHGRLAGFDQEGEGAGEFARAQRVVRGNGCGLGHGQDSGMAGRRRGRNPLGARRPPLAGC